MTTQISATQANLVVARPLGPRGLPPAHEWVTSSSLRFRNPDGSWGDAEDLRGPEGPNGDAQNFTTVADAIAATIDSGVAQIRTAGFSAAGVGGATYKKVGSEPSHAGKLQSADGAWWELVANPVRAEMLGGKLDGTTFEEGILQDGIAVAAALNTEFELPVGTLLVRTALTKSPLSTLRYYAADLVSNTRIRGVKGQTTIKIADAQSTDASVKDVNIFVVDGSLENISFDGIIFDCNGQNNPISPSRASHVYGFQCNGALNVTGDSAMIEGLDITNCDFINCAGTNSIVLGQNTNGTAGTLSKNVRIRNNRFIDNGLDTSDFTAIYGWADDLWVQFNEFIQSSDLDRTDRNWVALELHGFNTWFTHNKVQNYFRACWIASNFTHDCSGYHVTDNEFDVWGAGPSLFRELSSLTAISQVFILNNRIILREDGDVAIKYAVQFNTLYGIDGVYIRNNSITADGTGYDSYACSLGVGAGQTTSNVTFQENYVFKCQHGFYARVNDGDGTLTEINERDNVYVGLGASYPSGGGRPAAIGSAFIQAGSGAMGRISSLRNRHIVGGSTYDNGIFTSGAISDAELGGNRFFGVSTEINAQTNPIATHLRGDQARIITGATAGRPSDLTASDRGYTYYDTSLTKVIMWSGSGWLV